MVSLYAFRWDYDAVGNRIGQTDARSNTTYYDYNLLGRLTRTTDPLGQTEYYAYDNGGNRLSTVNRRGYATYTYYDAVNRQQGRIDALGNETYFLYDAVGNRTGTVNALGDATYMGYDAAGRQTGSTNPLGDSTQTEYDAVGNTTATVDGAGRPTYFDYDAASRRNATTNALGDTTYYHYDTVGNQTAVQDPLDHVTYSAYDAVNRLSSATDALGETTSFGYDAVGNRVSVTNARNHTTYYSYDAASRLAAITDALGRSAYYAYDATGNLTGSTDPDGDEIAFTYDSLNRQTGILYPNAAYTYYAFDAAGNRTAAYDARGWTYFTYDPLNRQTAEAMPNGRDVAWAYDAVSRRTAVATDAGAAYYAWDAASRMARVDDGADALCYYTYDGSGRVIQRVLDNGSFSYFDYDPAGRTSAIKHCTSDGAPLVYFEYGYDAASRIDRIAREDGTVIYYGYDNADRLTSEQWYNSGMVSLYAYRWDYDAAGNRIWQDADGVETYYAYDAANELLQSRELPADTWTYYTYDTRGNTTRIQEPDGTTYFAYNPANLVTSIHHKDGAWNYFHYDAQQRRYALQDSDGLAYLTWDSNGLNLLAEHDTEGNETARYTHGYTPIEGIGSVVRAQKPDGEGGTATQYLLANHHGDVIKIIDDAESVTAHYEYNAWGLPLRTENPTGGNRFRWQSCWMATENEAILLSPHRLYSPHLGVFLERDRPKDIGGEYAYCEGSPLYRVDAEGLQSSASDQSLPPDLERFVSQIFLAENQDAVRQLIMRSAPLKRKLGQLMASYEQLLYSAFDSIDDDSDRITLVRFIENLPGKREQLARFLVAVEIEMYRRYTPLHNTDDWKAPLEAMLRGVAKSVKCPQTGEGWKKEIERRQKLLAASKLKGFQRQTGIDIIALDWGKYVSAGTKFESFLQEAALQKRVLKVNSIQSLIAQIDSEIRSARLTYGPLIRIDTLVIAGEGSRGKISIGAGQTLRRKDPLGILGFYQDEGPIDPDTQELTGSKVDKLLPLKQHLTPASVVELRSCNTARGRGMELLQKLADNLGCSVKAYKGASYPGGGFGAVIVRPSYWSPPDELESFMLELNSGTPTP